MGLFGFLRRRATPGPAPAHDATAAQQKKALHEIKERVEKLLSHQELYYGRLQLHFHDGAHVGTPSLKSWVLLVTDPAAKAPAGFESHPSGRVILQVSSPQEGGRRWELYVRTGLPVPGQHAEFSDGTVLKVSQYERAARQITYFLQYYDVEARKRGLIRG